MVPSSSSSVLAISRRIRSPSKMCIRDRSRFLRCNQSYIVNMDYITSADTNFTMENGDKIPIKVRERKKIREQYFSYLLKLGWGCVDCDGMVENGKNNAV